MALILVQPHVWEPNAGPRVTTPLRSESPECWVPRWRREHSENPGGNGVAARSRPSNEPLHGDWTASLPVCQDFAAYSSHCRLAAASPPDQLPPRQAFGHLNRAMEQVMALSSRGSHAQCPPTPRTPCRSLLPPAVALGVLPTELGPTSVTVQALSPG